MGSITTRGTRSSASSTISGVTVEQVAFDAPWSWLAAGWRDMWTVPHVSLAYGVTFALAVGRADAGAAGDRAATRSCWRWPAGFC